MKTEEIKIRIAKKEAEIAKTEKLLAKYLNDASREEILVIGEFFKTGDYSLHRPFGYTDAWGKAVALYDARNTLAKYQKQLEAELAKTNTLNEMPKVLVEFKNNLIERWDRYDEWKKAQIRKECESEPDYYDRENYRTWHREMREKWGQGWHEFAYYTTTEQIHKANVQAAETIVLNLLERTVEIAGKITDCQCLRVDVDNQGYSIINGIVIGEKGKARVESIGAGGYNIQRYHVRVLVKEVRA